MPLEQMVRQYKRRFRGLLAGRGFRDAKVGIAAEAIEGSGELYASRSLDAAALRYPDSDRQGEERLVSALCRAAYLDSPAFRYWIGRLQLQPAYHRKLWEYALICQALYERGLLRAGTRGLGFAVGCEPLPALFANFGCEIVATDLAADGDRVNKWSRTNQWAGHADRLQHPAICDEATFRAKVTYQPADMNDIPATLRDFDFTWSSCSFEHCGSIALGARFIHEQMHCLKPGGWAVHTTEFNLTSNTRTKTRGSTVVFRRCDIENMCTQLRADGHYVEPLDLDVGNAPIDAHIDDKPYTNRHLRLRLGDWASTSIALIVRKGS